MRLLIAAVIGVIVLAGVFHEDLARFWAQHNPSVSASGGSGGAGRLGGASRRQFGGIGGATGDR